ncbi:hypothetical protein A7J50_2793 [Pseudomonas antarctica]|jgi:hypothetical protein|uniref:DUF3300 domain-containing protein n=2 Tax=Pseudomonas TaxID=286 RepID=A0A172Z176_9PSED|nr:hypothetical protein [Pseudomonas antarctica]ANF86190.1 hypothetical protein A7J50_2793 [Pseudomonas antarctica]MBX7276595.1 hypothetical protein [Pseudomonas sp. ERGC3:01]QZC93222.1 hypothetical protein K2E96_19815 [Pseudomonas sp. ERGC3:05]
MALMSRTVRALLLIPLTLAALASAPAFADTIIIRQPPRVIVVQAPPPPVYYGHWGYGPRPYYYPHHVYGYGYGNPHRPYWGGGWRGHNWR